MCHCSVVSVATVDDVVIDFLLYYMFLTVFGDVMMLLLVQM